MVFLFLVPLYMAVNLYMLMRIFHWAQNCSRILDKRRFMIPTGTIYFLCALSPLLAFLLPKSAVAVVIRRFSTWWMGIMLYGLMFIALGDLLGLIVRRTRLKDTKLFSRIGAVSVGAVIMVTTAAFCVYGVINARNIRTTPYELTVNKKCGELDELNIVLIADTHLGYAIGKDHMESMVEKINACEPDIVIIAGDLFDNSIDGIDDPDRVAELFRSIKSKYGVWATFGNHDIDEKILMGFTFNWGESSENSEDMKAFLEKANINLLQDSSVLIDNAFYLVGRRDAHKPGTEDGSRLSPEQLTEGLDLTKPVFFVDHEPSELEETANAGADVDLSGHTHDGQLFPGNITVKMMWENPYGMIQKDGMYSIVTSGVGIFGPFMRIGTHAEICDINVKFSDN